MDWRELITDIYRSRPQPPGVSTKPRFHAAAAAEEIADAEARLGATLSGSLRSLLLESNGVMDMMAVDGGAWFESKWLLWTVGEIVEQNRHYRTATENGTYTRDFDKLVFFASAGCDGILFGFPVADDRTCASRVVVWHPIMDEVDELAPSLEDFLRGWLTGAIAV